MNKIKNILEHCKETICIIFLVFIIFLGLSFFSGNVFILSVRSISDQLKGVSLYIVGPPTFIGYLFVTIPASLFIIIISYVINNVINIILTFLTYSNKKLKYIKLKLTIKLKRFDTKDEEISCYLNLEENGDC